MNVTSRNVTNCYNTGRPNVECLGKRLERRLNVFYIIFNAFEENYVKVNTD